MPTINSSCISWVDYDPATQVMYIAFHRTGTYTLQGVPHYHYVGLLTASSAGRYFNRYLRGRY